MRKRSLKERLEKMKIEAANINSINNINKYHNHVEEKGNSIKIIANKPKSVNKKIKKKEEIKQLEVIIEKKYINFDLDFIYRREKYTLTNLKEGYSISTIRDLISKKISVNAKDLRLYYKDQELKVIEKEKTNDEKKDKELNDKELKEKELAEKELKEKELKEKASKEKQKDKDKDKELKEDDKDKELKEEEKEINVYELIKNDNAPFLDVRKESQNNQNIISLNTKVNLIYKVHCKPVSSYLDLVNKVEQFFRDICLEKHYLCEPTAKDEYDVCFSCSDHCFQFKRYMMNISRTDAQYKKTKFDIPKVDKSKIIEPKIEKNKENEEIDENINKTEKIKSVYYNQKTKIKTEVDIEFKRMKHKEDDYFQKEFINTGPYVKYEEIKKKQENDDKKKWISKKKFSVV